MRRYRLIRNVWLEFDDPIAIEFFGERSRFVFALDAVEIEVLGKLRLARVSEYRILGFQSHCHFRIPEHEESVRHKFLNTRLMKKSRLLLSGARERTLTLDPIANWFIVVVYGNCKIGGCLCHLIVVQLSNCSTPQNKRLESHS